MPIPLIAGALGGLAIGGVKSLLGAEKEKRDRQLAADTQRYSPWTGMQAGPIEKNDVVGNLLQGGIGGALQGQSIGAALEPAPLFDPLTGNPYYDTQTGLARGKRPDMTSK